MASDRTTRRCYVCGRGDNPIIAEERCERRFDRPFMPEGVYRFARCKACGTLYVDSDVTDAYLNDLYAMETEESVLELLPTVPRPDLIALRMPEFEHHWHHLTAHRPSRPGDRLLDMGCQTGEFGAVAARDGVLPNGTELSAEYAATCRRLWGGASVIHEGHLDSAPFTVEEFQYITAFETLEHVCDPIAELQWLKVWLAADGVFAMSVPSSDYFHLKYWLLTTRPLSHPLRRLAEKRQPFYKNQILPHSHVYSFTPRSVRLLLKRAGFEVLEVGLSGWHARTPWLAIALGDMVTFLSKGRFAVAPSVFAVARRTLAK